MVMIHGSECEKRDINDRVMKEVIETVIIAHGETIDLKATAIATATTTATTTLCKTIEDSYLDALLDGFEVKGFDAIKIGGDCTAIQQLLDKHKGFMNLRHYIDGLEFKNLLQSPDSDFMPTSLVKLWNGHYQSMEK
jgi:hypothetical protein